jgi:hypothetical protein
MWACVAYLGWRGKPPWTVTTSRIITVGCGTHRVALSMSRGIVVVVVLLFWPGRRCRCGVRVSPVTLNDGEAGGSSSQVVVVR